MSKNNNNFNKGNFRKDTRKNVFALLIIGLVVFGCICSVFLAVWVVSRDIRKGYADTVTTLSRQFNSFNLPVTRIRASVDDGVYSISGLNFGYYNQAYTVTESLESVTTQKNYNFLNESLILKGVQKDILDPVAGYDLYLSLDGLNWGFGNMYTDIYGIYTEKPYFIIDESIIDDTVTRYTSYVTADTFKLDLTKTDTELYLGVFYTDLMDDYGFTCYGCLGFKWTFGQQIFNDFISRVERPLLFDRLDISQTSELNNISGLYLVTTTLDYSFYADPQDSSTTRYHFYISSYAFIRDVDLSALYITPRTYYFNINADNNYYYNLGYNNGYSSGDNDGFQRARREFDGLLIESTDNAYRTGYNVGYNQGSLDSGEYTFLGLMSSIVDVPIRTIGGLMNFDLLGVNLLGFFYALLTVGLIIFIIRLVIGGK